MRKLRCRDVGFDCDAEVRAQTDEEVLQQAAEHAQEAHKVTVTPEMANQIKTLIRDDDEQP